MTWRRTLTIASLILLGSCALTPAVEVPAAGPARDASLVAGGREVAMNHCARCHSVDPGLTSPNADAPSFVGLLARYDAEMLANHLIEGVRLGHDAMPVIDLDVRSADALVAFMKDLDASAQARPHRPKRIG